MKKNIISAVIGIMIGLPICVYAEETRPAPAVYETNTSYHYELPEELPAAGGEDFQVQIQEEDYEADLQLLACLIEAEAGNQDLTGKRLVADVVLNRVADPRFPDTIPGVIFQPGQFSPVTNGALAKAFYTVSEDDFKAVSMEIVDQIDYAICFFTAEGYGCGTPAYKYGGHYFSK